MEVLLEILKFTSVKSLGASIELLNIFLTEFKLPNTLWSDKFLSFIWHRMENNYALKRLKFNFKKVGNELKEITLDMFEFV